MTPESLILCVNEIGKESSKNAEAVAVKSKICDENRGENVFLWGKIIVNFKYILNRPTIYILFY